MRRASVIRLALLACLWGASFLFIKVALRGLSPVQIVLGRLALQRLARSCDRHGRCPAVRWAHGLGTVSR
jgi:hypothetical protein